MEKKSEITVGGAMQYPPIDDHYLGAETLSSGPEEITVVSNPPLSPEHAQALRQVDLQPEPIPEGALYHVRAYAETGEPCSHEVLAGFLGEEAATDLGKVTTHAHAVEACLAANEKLEALGASVWLGVYVPTEVEGPSSESTGTGVP